MPYLAYYHVCTALIYVFTQPLHHKQDVRQGQF